jgi:hypothetical protein
MFEQIDRSQKAAALPVPAPVGGLNARDALANMPNTDASVLENMFPYVDRVETRAGFVQLSDATPIATGIGVEGFVQLMSWGAGQAFDQVFGVYQWLETVAAITRGRIRIMSIATDGTLATSRDIVASGAADSVRSIGEWCQFGSLSGTTYTIIAASTQLGNFLPQAYDGTAWTSPAITGVPIDTLGVTSHRNRLWFYNAPGAAGSAGPLTAYYLPTGAISGTVAQFNLAPFATKGGRIVAMRTWTRDGGDGGADDLAVFVTNRGQVLLFAGIDPASSSTWELTGVFDVGPVACLSSAMESGTNALNNPGFGTGANLVRDAYAMKYGSDMLLNLQTGVTSANRIFRPDAEGKDFTLSSKIRALLTDASKTWMTNINGNSASNVPLWKLSFIPSFRQLFVCIPTARTPTTGVVERTTVTCYVMNTESGAWAKFTGFNARDMLLVGNAVYFIDGTTKVFKYDGTALDDAGTAITFESRQAYDYLNSPNNKQVTLMQPMLRATGNFSLTVQADADFNAGSISAYTSYTVASTQNLQPKISPSKYGRAFAVHMKGQTSVGVVSWYATNWLAVGGGIVG